MAKTDNLTDFLTGVADAIRAKKGTTAKINPQNFETEIGSITASKPEQEKTVVPTNAQQTVLPDSGKTLSKVIIKSAPLPDSNNFSYKNTNGCLIEIKTKTLIVGCEDSVIPSDGSVTSIGDYAFYNCSRLTSITISDNVTSIGSAAFWGCSELTNIIIGKGLTSIDSSAFTYCDTLASINVSSDNIKYHSEGDCLIETESKTLTLGCVNSSIPTDGSVTSIGKNAFDGRTKLTGITIPDSVTAIGYGAFGSCYRLTSVIIPNSVVSIGGAAFYGCSGLTSMTIPNNVSSIGDQAFENCDKLTSIIVLNATPPKLVKSAFKRTAIETITVPIGCGEAYKTADGWSAYADKIVEVTA